MRTRHCVTSLVLAMGAAIGVPQLMFADGQAVASTPAAATVRSAVTPAATVVVPPAGYVIGPDDVLGIMFWRDKDMSLEAIAVRPDGKITLPLLNDVLAAGFTPDQLRDRVTQEARAYVEDPNVTIFVRQINSRKVFVAGEVTKPGPYPLMGATTVLQMIATAGGIREYADAKNIAVVRIENGRTVTYPFNYRDVARRKNLKQNIELKPGDTIVIP
jgi:polysaccharide export outer membrane protein